MASLTTFRLPYCVCGVLTGGTRDPNPACLIHRHEVITHRVHPVTAQAMRDLQAAIADVRTEIVDAETLRDAYLIWDHVKAMSLLLRRLEDDAAKRCEALLEDL